LNEAFISKEDNFDGLPGADKLSSISVLTNELKTQLLFFKEVTSCSNRIRSEPEFVNNTFFQFPAFIFVKNITSINGNISELYTINVDFFSNKVLYQLFQLKSNKKLFSSAFKLIKD